MSETRREKKTKRVELF